MREYSLERKIVQSGENKPSGDVERGVDDGDVDLTPTNTVAHPEEPTTDGEKVEEA